MELENNDKNGRYFLDRGRGTDVTSHESPKINAA